MTPESPVTDVRNDALRLLSNGLYVLTACLSDTVHAATVSWVSQVSFQPPLVMVALQRNSHLAHAVRKAHRFAINILGAEQDGVGREVLRPSHGAGRRRRAWPDMPFETARPTARCSPTRWRWIECRFAAEPADTGRSQPHAG